MLLSGADTAVIDGVPCYIQTIARSRGYLAAHIVPKTGVDKSNISLIIFGTITIMTVLCAALYYITGYFSSRQIIELELAMEHVGTNNLSYRIPVHNTYDEFGKIAVKFQYDV